MASSRSNSNIPVGRDDHESICSNADRIATGCSNPNILVGRNDHELKCSNADQIEPHSDDESDADDADIVNEFPIVPCANPPAALNSNADPEMMEDKEVLLNSYEDDASVDKHERWSSYESNVPRMDEYNLNSEARLSDEIEDKITAENDLKVVSFLAFHQQHMISSQSSQLVVNSDSPYSPDNGKARVSSHESVD
ncbi:hypothetical protein Nepgr_001030 [Nepenthes gracilis]|uniref:Uncharacterized protein n=1 Tax=Nepenthes gracilis TaxID=150966 RepID=A0AAD3P473_NEPGR|nr:hypothetical protein Nepgr_001030 [Nepenthes gracilis]